MTGHGISTIRFFLAMCDAENFRSYSSIFIPSRSGTKNENIGSVKMGDTNLLAISLVDVGEKHYIA